MRVQDPPNPVQGRENIEFAPPESEFGEYSSLCRTQEQSGPVEAAGDTGR
ncbi:hypothetical protein [Nocardia carnea]|nr:hypothetical protein [Nocardia carnea]